MAFPCPVRISLAVLLGALLLTPLVPGPALAGPAARAVSAEAAAYLVAHPGGTVLNDNEISYGDGDLIVTLRAKPRSSAAADCPLGWYCFYDRPNFGYPRGKLSSCGRQNLATWDWQFRIESVHYNMGSGSVTFYYDGSPLFTVGSGNHVRTDASPYRNWANYVSRTCY
ncbi:peptidase inhibitor family I36 protein [Micromonospora humida]|uniref:peptidase inhibitor family I36 protein n=1 Tax=Micromonospora humida TaxID=2809018 RepID=UPI00340E6D8D